MAEVSEQEAVAKARLKLDLGPIAACVWRVRFVDVADKAYYLIVFGEPQAATGVAIVDVKSGELMTWASLPGTAPHLMFDSEAAIKKARFPVGAQAELVWKSCPASRSPIYPIWRITTEEKTVYVDQQGILWQSLESSGLGG